MRGSIVRDVRRQRWDLGTPPFVSCPGGQEAGQWLSHEHSVQLCALGKVRLFSSGEANGAVLWCSDDSLIDERSCGRAEQRTLLDETFYRENIAGRSL